MQRSGKTTSGATGQSNYSNIHQTDDVDEAPMSASGQRNTDQTDFIPLVQRYEGLDQPSHSSTDFVLPRFVELIFTAMFLYTLITMIVVAYYVAWDFHRHETGVKVSLVMASILFYLVLISCAFKCWDWVKGC